MPRLLLPLLLSACPGPSPMLDAGDTFDGPGSPLPDWVVQFADATIFTCDGQDLRLQAWGEHALRLTRRAPDQPWPVDRGWILREPPPSVPFEIEGRGDDAIVHAELLTVGVDQACRVRVLGGRGHIVLDDLDDGGWSLVDGEPSVMRALGEDTRLLGLGEKLGPLDRRGGSYTFWNTDAYETSWGGYGPQADPLYLSIPLVIGVEDDFAWGVLSLNTHRMALDLGASSPDRWSASWEGGLADELLIVRDTLPEVVETYTGLTGRTPLPPRWALGYHQSRWGYHPDDRLRELAERFRALDLPADSLWFDIQHMDGFRSFTWDPVGFPDPAGLLAELRDEGFRSVAIVDPGLKQEPGWGVYDELIGGGHALRTPGGSPFVGRAWPGDSVFPDFSRAETRLWWAGQVAELAADGLDGIWLDVNEPTTFPEGGAGTTVDNDVIVDGDGVPTTMAELHNAYANLQAAATVEGLRQAHPDRRPFVLSRAGFAGIQRHAGVWTGDVPSTWWGLRDSLLLSLHLGLSGVPMSGSDIGGYSGSPSPELFARWMALGVISPFFRGHVTQGVPDQEPWAFGTEVTDLSRDLLKLRMRLRPYLYSLLHEHTETGAPVLRPMLWHFADMTEVGDQAMLGRWLMAAPVLDEGVVEREVLFPGGRWYELHSGAIIEDVSSYVQDVTLASLPLYVRDGAILPLGPADAFEQGGLLDPLELQLYPRTGPTQLVLYDDAGDGSGESLRLTLDLQLRTDGAALTATREGAWGAGRTFELRFRRVDHPATGVTLAGQRLRPLESFAPEAGEGWWWDPNDRSLRVRVVDPGVTFVVRATYDPTIEELAPPVLVPLRVRLPPGTPLDATIHVATDADDWVHHVLRREGDEAVGEVLVPRGRWFRYKYSRGDWCTVEKWPDCGEALDRYAFGAAEPGKVDEVFGWRDGCPDACQ
jgi:alpha-glucosidase